MDCSSFESLVAAAGANNIPIGAVFELTHRCNLRCAHCYLSDYCGKGELTSGQWKTVISDFASMGGLWLSFTGGEIFLRKDIFELIEHARSCGFALKLLTNALLITPDIAKRLEQLWPAEIHVSLYAAEPALHDQVTGMQGSYERTLAAVRALRELGLSVTLKTPIMVSNLSQMQQIQELADSLGATLRLDTDIMPKNDRCRAPFLHRLDDDGLDKLFETNQMAHRIPPPGLVPPDPSSDLCGAARRTFSISPTGDVQPCLSNPVPAGNVVETPLPEIWESSPLLLQYRGYRMADLSARCLECEHLSYCSRCSALASLEDGDYLGASCWACRMSEARSRAAAKARNSFGGGA